MFNAFFFHVVYGIPFLVTAIVPIRMILSTKVKSNKLDALYDTLAGHLLDVKSKGFKIREYSVNRGLCSKH